MKKIALLFLGIVLFWGIGAFCEAGELPVLAVVGFENHSAIRNPDLANMGLQYLENALLSCGEFTLADRLTVQNSLTEIGFSSASGLVDPAYAIQLGKMLGARYLAIGDVVDVTSRTTEFQGYGIKTSRTTLSVTVGLRVIDAERGVVLFVDQQSLAREGIPLQSIGASAQGESLSTLTVLTREAIEELVDRFCARFVQRARKTSSTLKKVKITVDSSPQGADVEIGGIFYGNTPCELLLEEDSVVEIKVSLAGYTTWAKKVKVVKDLRIMTKRERVNVSQGSPTVEVKVGIEKEKEGENQR